MKSRIDTDAVGTTGCKVTIAKRSIGSAPSILPAPKQRMSPLDVVRIRKAELQDYLVEHEDEAVTTRARIKEVDLILSLMKEAESKGVQWGGKRKF